ACAGRDRSPEASGLSRDDLASGADRADLEATAVTVELFATAVVSVDRHAHAGGTRDVVVLPRREGDAVLRVRRPEKRRKRQTKSGQSNPSHDFLPDCFLNSVTDFTPTRPACDGKASPRTPRARGRGPCARPG